MSAGNWLISPFLPQFTTQAVYNRIAYLESLTTDPEMPQIAGLSPDEQEELTALHRLAVVLEEHKDKSTLRSMGLDVVNATFMDNYLEDVVLDTYGNHALDKWPFNCIDWSRARNVKLKDYWLVKFADYNFYIHK